jgi:hypothetical protein
MDNIIGKGGEKPEKKRGSYRVFVPTLRKNQEVEMMGKSKVLLIVPLMLMLAVSISYAAFDNSHHDMRSYATETEGCFHCHGRSDTNALGAQPDNFGNVGGLCLARCHIGGGGILGDINQVVPDTAPSVDTADYTTSTAGDYTAVYFSSSHNRTPGNLKDGTGAAVTWPPSGVNWPYLASGTDIECTSCHSVHDNANAPFLWDPLYAASAQTGFCDRCHQGRSTQNLTGAPDGMHPVDFAVDNTAASTRTGNTRNGRRIVIQKYGLASGAGTVDVFDVNNVAASALVNTGTSWNMGGHLQSSANAAMVDWTGGGSTQHMGCYTCHSAHRTNVNGENNLVVVLTFDAANGWNPLCVGCHGASTSRAADLDEDIVGAETNYGHPVGSVTAVQGTFTTNAVNTYNGSLDRFNFGVQDPAYVDPTAQNGNQFGTNGELMCMTCHKVHYGTRMALAQLGQTGTQSVCKQCHNGNGLPNVNDLSKGGAGEPVNTHHRTATSVTVGTHTPTNESEALAISQPTWADTISGIGDIDGKAMDCADCHVFNGTAHNW